MLQLVQFRQSGRVPGRVLVHEISKWGRPFCMTITYIQGSNFDWFDDFFLFPKISFKKIFIRCRRPKWFEKTVWSQTRDIFGSIKGQMMIGCRSSESSILFWSPPSMWPMTWHSVHTWSLLRPIQKKIFRTLRICYLKSWQTCLNRRFRRCSQSEIV